MKDAYLVTAVQCHGCGLVANLTPPTIVATKDEIEKVGSFVHKGSKVVCIKPKLVILFGPVLVSNELALTPPVVDTEGNGHGLIVKGG